jgi:ATP-binding cassette subfamily F protein 3
MSLIVGTDIRLRYGDHEVLRNVSFRVEADDRIGVVGPNGEGKTTLLKIAGRLLETTGGEVHHRQDLRLGYLPQDPPALEGHTIHDAMLEVFSDLRLVEEQLLELTNRMDDSNPVLVDAYGKLQHEFESLGGYTYRNRIQQVLTGLGFGPDMWDRPLAKLSGGQRTRAYLATLLLREPDVLLLDEPTNHLDIASCEWLERWLQGFGGAVLVVSHDRYFLDRVTTRTWEVAFKRLEAYRGPYTKYLRLREDRYRERMQEWEAQQEYIRKTEEFIRIHMAGQRTAEAKGRRKRLQRFLEDAAVPKPERPRAIHFSLHEPDRTGDVVLIARKLRAGFEAGKPLVAAKSLEVLRGQRIAIVGANGSGKTTLLRTLLKELTPLAGDVRHGSKVTFGYLSQTHTELNPGTTAVDSVVSAHDGCMTAQARGLLGGLLLSGRDAFKRIGELSGGQRSRVALARIVVQKATVLMLDEPTNHLDVPSVEILQDVLGRFSGSILFVSHDRYLVEALATHVWAIEDGGVHAIIGGWSAYLEWREKRPRPAVAPAHTGSPTKEQAASKGAGTLATGRTDTSPDSPTLSSPSPPPRALSTRERTRLTRRLRDVEDQIEGLEDELEKLNAAINDAAVHGRAEALRLLSDDHRSRNTELQKLWAEWELVTAELEG